jgi:hypothetical protein
MAPVKPQVPANIIEGAQNLGWFANPALKNMSFGTGFNQPSTGVAEGGNNSLFNTIETLRKSGLNPADPLFKDLLTINAIVPQQQSWDQRQKELDYVAKQKREEADYRQKLGEESTQKALLYSSIGNIGNTLTTAIAGTPEQRQRVNNAYTNALESTSYIRPSTLIVSPGSAIGQKDYFK